jgi:hypothetical protein
MTAFNLNQLLEQALAAYNLVVQASQQDECLSIVLNRPAEEHLDYSAIAKIITERVKTLEIGEIHSLFLSSRVLGEYDVDWQTQFEFVSPSSPESAVVQSVATDNENSSPPTNETVETTTESLPTPDEVEKSPYANYCFISNKSLLTFQVLPPDETLSKLIQFFDNLPNSLKADILPLLEKFFTTSVVSPVEQFDLEIQQWFEQLTQLNAAQIRKATIWFSRYCFNPEKTMRELMPMIEPEPVIAEVPQEVATETAKTPAKSDRQRPTQTHTTKTQKTAAVKLNPLALPIGWLVLTLIIIVCAVGSFDSNKVIAAACKNPTGKPEYCKLAVQLVGAATFHDAAQQFTTPMPVDIKDESLRSCIVQANIYAGKTLRESLESKIPALSSYGEEVLPGIFIADIKQTNFKQPGAFVRTGCVTANGGKHAALLGSDIIPTSWPEQPFAGKPTNQETFRKSLGVFNILLALGTGTLFDAVAIFLVSVWGIGIRVDSLETVYKAAFFLGILETMISLIPSFSIFMSISLTTLALGLISLVIKDFHVEWTAGSKVVAAGTILIIAIPMFLRIMLFSMMTSLLH